ncbi:MAG: tetratricopeptide repeat protein, partial [Candidatus Margulisiibacteriota bacterium]
PILFECEAKLKENPLDVMTLFTLSKWYYAKGLVNESLAIVRQIIKIEPNFLPAHDFLSQQNSSPSSTDLPENIGTLEDMGINYFNSNNFKEAEVIFKKILKLNAKHPAAQRYLADIYTKNNDFESAIHILNRLTLQFPEDAMILFNLAVACFNASDYNRARSNLKAAKKLTRDQGLLSEINQFLTHLMQFE